MPLGWRLAGLVFLTHQSVAQRGRTDAQRLACHPQSRTRSWRNAARGVAAYLPAAQSAVLDAYFDLAEPLRPILPAST